MGIYCTVFYHQQQVMRFFQLLPFITTLCSNETLSCKKPLLPVGNKTQCSKYPLQLASGFITDLFTKIDRPIKKTEKICKRLLHPKSITNIVVAQKMLIRIRRIAARIRRIAAWIIWIAAWIRWITM